jgi:hypothetical protein
MARAILQAAAKTRPTATIRNLAVEKWAIRAILVLVAAMLASWLDSIKVNRRAQKKTQKKFKSFLIDEEIAA